ncbi:hypothetical protein [Clostridium perfringens]|uniref:hypothetical protein n=1 Tax=Clostridium perfringens TaxID=1502 RepID=UPI001ABA4E29|nr:hypothetical protein [Clostridium perfringens]MBO3361340.1 hypothetical protein [Clostridium perfringens]HBI6884501.1 hypothetical protein [Clostridium perfringens]
MKKLISVFMIIMLGMTLFIGCGNPSVIGKVETKPVMNGTGDKEIGKYGEAEYNPEKLTDEDLLKFYNENIKDSGLNWFTLINKNNKTQGIMFPGCNVVLEYGTVGEDGNISTVEESRIIDGNTIKDMK